MNQSPEAAEAQEEMAFERTIQRGSHLNMLDAQKAEIAKMRGIANCLQVLAFAGGTFIPVAIAVVIKVVWG
jgi:hypothetical protein